MDRRLTILIGENGTIQIYTEDLSTNQQRWISGIFLLVGFCIGLGLGLVALIGLRFTSGYPRTLIGLILTTVLDTIQGQVLGAVFLAVVPNVFWCRVSACTSTTLLLIQTAEVALLTYHPHILVDILPWILGGLIVILMSTFQQYTPVHFYPQRHGCSMHGGGDVWTPQIFMTVWLGGSWLWMAAGLSDFQGASNRASKSDVLISRITVAIYGLLVLPHGLMLLATSFSTRPNLENVYMHETVFIWARYLFNLITPLIVLLLYKDVRKNSGNLFLWCRKNENSLQQIPRNISKLKNVIRKKKRIKPISEIKCKLTTPVLFATSQGLYLRTVGQKTDESNFKSLELICVRCDQEDIESTIESQEDDILPPEAKKNVRFSSQVYEVPLNESGVWSNNDDGDAQKHSVMINHEVGITYTKMNHGKNMNDNNDNMNHDNNN